MDFEITEERVVEVAKRYGLTAEKSNETGFYIDDERISSDDLFNRLFGRNVIQEEIEINNFPKSIKYQKRNSTLGFKNLNNRFIVKGDGVA